MRDRPAGQETAGRAGPGPGRVLLGVGPVERGAGRLASGFSSVFTAFYSVLAVLLVVGLLWLEGLLMRSRSIPAISFTDIHGSLALQRFQASLSGSPSCGGTTSRS